MGLLAKTSAGITPAKAPNDDVLLLHGMMLMASADGVIEAKEIATLEAFFNTLPEFEGKDFDELMLQARKLCTKYEDLKESVKALADIKSPAIRKKLFILAVDIAMSSGDVDESEDEMLEAYMRILNIEEAMAKNVIEILGAKYAQ
jgi:uncharacterized tellurite resistance protein B-like protein